MSPELDEAGGRDVVRYLNDLCEGATISVLPDSRSNSGVITICDGVDISENLIEENMASFNDKDCAIRDFVDVTWALDYCSVPPQINTRVVPGIITLDFINPVHDTLIDNYIQEQCRTGIQETPAVRLICKTE